MSSVLPRFIGAALVCLVMSLSPAPLAAVPVKTLLTGETTAAEQAFFTDLRSLWQELLAPTPARLSVRSMADPRQRLRALSRRRADFAVVNAATASVFLGNHPRLTALAILWADLLHPMTRAPNVKTLGLPPKSEVWVFHQAPYPYPILLELSRASNKTGAPILLLEDDLALDALEYAQGPILLHSAPWPDPLLQGILGRDPALRLVSFDPQLLENFTLAVPWLIPARLPARSYPGQNRGLELPALHHVLIARRDVDQALARKMLDSLYRHRRAMAPFNPLFKRLKGSLNAVFGKVFPFHPLTAKRFNFTSSVP